MKVNRFGILGLALVTAFGMTACDEGTVTPPPPITVQVVPPSASLEVGQTIALVAVVQNAANQNVTWTSAAPGVASVNAQGVVTAVAPGTAVITAASQQDPNARGAAAIVVVAAAPPPPISVNVQPQQASVQVGGSVSLVAQVVGSTNQTVTWESAAPAIATVNATTGVVTGVAPGQAVIRARSAADPTVTGLATVTVTAEAVPTVIVVPNQATLFPQETITLSAVVQGHTNQAVTWSSATPGVATVSAAGVVTAVAPGTALIRATSVANPAAVGVAQIVVEQRPGGNVSIERLTDAAGNTVNPANVSGTVNVVTTINAPVGSGVTTVRLVAVCPNGEREIARQGVTAGTTGQIVFTWNTAEFDGATGQPFYMSGTCQLRGELLTATGAVTASATAGPYTLTNQNTVALVMTTVGVTSPGSIFAGGVEWREGNVVVTAAPVLFTGGTVSSVTVCVQAVDGPVPGPACRTTTAATNGVFSVTFPKANTPGAAAPGVAGITTTQLHAYATTVLATGAAGPAIAFGAGPNIRLDNVAPNAPPAPVAPAAGSWVAGTFQFNRATVFGAGFTAANLEALEVPPGVGGVTQTFHVFAGTEAQYTALGTSEAARMAAVVAGGTQVTTGADLPGTTVPSGYILVVRTRDALGNFVDVRAAGQFGVDRVAPQFNFVDAVGTGSPANMTINPTTAFQFDFPFVEGNVSGTIFEPQVRIIRYRAGTAVACINVTTGVATTVPAAGCPFVQHTATTVTIHADAGDGYFELSFRFSDNAGNLSPVQTRLVLRDVTAPGVAVSGTFSLTATQFTGSATITDNVDIRGWDPRLEFGAMQLPVAPLTQVGTFGTATRVGTTTASATIPLWRSLRVVDAGSTPVGALAGVTQLSGAGFGAFDMARNFNSGFHAVVQAGNATPAGLTHFRVTPSGSTFCNGITPRPSGDQGVADCPLPAPAAPATRTVTAIAEGPTGFNQPFSIVHFYRVDPQGNIWYIGNSTAVVAGSVGDVFQHRWSFTADATGWQGSFAVGDQSIFAVGVSAARDAFRSQNAAITVRGAANQP
jgi:uncharacterized protein YjdB